MDMLKTFLAGLIGLFVLGIPCFALFFVLAIAVHLLPGSDLFIAPLVPLVILTGILGGPIFGILLYLRKPHLVSVFSFSRSTLLTNSLCAGLTLVCSIALYLSNLQSTTGKLLLIPEYWPVGLMIYVAMWVGCYLFTCFLQSFFSSNELFDQEKPILFILALITNPLCVVLVFVGMSTIILVHTTEPCGVELASFTADSPAKAAGLQQGQVIVKINEWDIYTLNDAKQAADSLSDKELALFIVSTGQQYNVQPAFVPDLNKTALGVVWKNKRCSQ